MFISKKNGATHTFEISSEMALVDRVVVELKEWLDDSEKLELGNLVISLRELLTNAIEHGNKNNPERKILCNVRKLKGDRYSLTVEDEGEGFDHANVDFNMPHPDQDRNRGFALINRLADSFKFANNGNRVVAYVSISRRTDFNMDKSADGYTVISPSGPLTAGCSEQFRKTLIELLDTGIFNIRLDMESVADIDSISLSVLFSFIKTLDENKEESSFEIVNVNNDIWNLFNLTRLATQCVVFR